MAVFRVERNKGYTVMSSYDFGGILPELSGSTNMHSGASRAHSSDFPLRF